MKNTIISFLMIFMLFTNLEVSGTIHETDQIADVIHHADADSVIFFHMNKTLYAPFGSMADDRWIGYVREHIDKVVDEMKIPGYIGKDNIKKMVFTMMLNTIGMVPKKCMETRTAEVISTLQEGNIPVLGVTRAMRLHPWNFQILSHLKTLGIDLEKTLIYFPAVQNDHNAPPLGQYTFVKGVLFTNSMEIPTTLLAFLEKNGSLNHKLVYVDNSLESLKKIENAFEDSAVNFEGIYYNKTVEFDPILGIIQWMTMNSEQIISDDEARKIKLENPEFDYEQELDRILGHYAHIFLIQCI